MRERGGEKKQCVLQNSAPETQLCTISYLTDCYVFVYLSSLKGSLVEKLAFFLNAGALKDK